MALPLTDADFSFTEELFRSQTGTVWRVSFRKRAAAGTSEALRQVGLRDGATYVLKERRAPELGQQKTIMREIDLLRKLDHPNIVRCLGHFRGRARGGAPPRGGGVRSDDVLYMVLEYANGGDLYKEVCRRKKVDNSRRAGAGSRASGGIGAAASGRHHFTEREVLDIFYQLCLGVQHLHERGIVHRDIKALNVLRSGKEGRWTYKLGDLGVGRELGLDTIMMQTFYGTPLYASPELCANQPYNELTDIWSLGVLLYEICALDHPFSARNLMGLAKAISEADYPPLAADLYSPFLRDMVAAMLKKDWKKRPRINEVIGWLEVPGRRPHPLSAEEDEEEEGGVGVRARQSLVDDGVGTQRRPDSRKSRAGSKGTRRPPSAVSSLLSSRRASAAATAVSSAAVSKKKRASSGIRGRDIRSGGGVSTAENAERDSGKSGRDRNRGEDRDRRRARAPKSQQAWQDPPAGGAHREQVQHQQRPRAQRQQVQNEEKRARAPVAKEEKVLTERERKRASRRDKTIRVRREQSHQRHEHTWEELDEGADEFEQEQEEELNDNDAPSGRQRRAQRIRVSARKRHGQADAPEDRFSLASSDGSAMSGDSLEGEARVLPNRRDGARRVTAARNGRRDADDVKRSDLAVHKARRGSRRASSGTNNLQPSDSSGVDSSCRPFSESGGESFSDGEEYTVDLERKTEAPVVQAQVLGGRDRRDRRGQRDRQDRGKRRARSSTNDSRNSRASPQQRDHGRNPPRNHDDRHQRRQHQPHEQQQEDVSATEIAARLNVTRRPLDKTSRQEQRAENELRRKRLHLERLVKAKGWQKGQQQQQQQHTTEIESVRKEIESLHGKITARRKHAGAKKNNPPLGNVTQDASQKGQLQPRQSSRPYAYDEDDSHAAKRERRRGVGRGDALRNQRASARAALYRGGSRRDEDRDGDGDLEDYSRPSTRSSASSLRDERLEQRWLERSNRIVRSRRGGGGGGGGGNGDGGRSRPGPDAPLLVVGGLHGRSGSRVSSAGSSAGSSASRAARGAKRDQGRVGCGAREGRQTSRYSRAVKGFASMLTDDNGLSHTRAGLALRQHHHHRGRGASRASVVAALKAGESESESESDDDSVGEGRYGATGATGTSDASNASGTSGVRGGMGRDRQRRHREGNDDEKGERGEEEEDLWMTDEIGDLKLQKEAYERRLDLHKIDVQRRPGMSRFTGHVGGINDGSVDSARSWNPITSSWSSVSSSER
jgi:NIMA (never in mitosis gene a)-related kinase